jgi:hypothetical protein
MLVAENWCVKVEDKVYGPYTTEQMRKYAHEGRLAGWSLISPAGGRDWREASRESAFAQFFGAAKKPQAAAAGRTFGKLDQPEAEPTAANGRRPKAQVPANANFVIVFDAAEGAANRLELTIRGMGPAFRVAENVWSLTCDLTAVGVRNALAPYLSPKESIFVVDASRGRASWQNYAPEAHSKISSAYTAPVARAKAS